MTEKIQTLVGIPPKERARLQEVEQKAIALLREYYEDVLCYDESPRHAQYESLREAIGITVEELRGGCDTCECHERDSSYVCESCYKKGLRGHMQKGGE